MPAAELPEGCREEDGGYACEFTTSSTEGVLALAAQADTYGRVSFLVPAYERNTISLSVTLDGTNRGWYVYLNETSASESRLLLLRRAPASDAPSQQRHRDTSEHYVEVNTSRELSLVFWMWSGYQGSAGTFLIEYRASPAPQGTRPERPAATASDPHVVDDIGDVARAWLDIEAFWLDDAGLDDGLMDAHLKLADLASLPEQAELDVAGYFWSAEFDLLGTRYAINWDHATTCAVGAVDRICYVNTADTAEGARTCEIVRVDASDTVGGGVELTDPTCGVDEENSTLHAVFPESILGDPGPGVEFTAMRVLTGSVLRPLSGRHEAGSAAGDYTRHEDGSSGERFVFALGGPAVWCEHRAGACVPALAWYEAPLAPENVPNTLQVLGALFALLAFLAGLVLVRRRRARVRRLLAEVEAVVDAHKADAARGLLALGGLEDSLDARLRRGKITDAEYQIASQRIATSATRLAMRRDLGLDDGMPDADVAASRSRRPGRG